MDQLSSIRILAVCALLLVVTACEGLLVATESDPTYALRFELREDTDAIAQLDYEIDGSPLSKPIGGSVEIDGSTATAILQLPVGIDYSILLRGFNANDDPVCVGSGLFSIQDGGTTDVQIALVCSTSSDQPEGTIQVNATFMLNICPVISVLDVSPQDVLLGQSTMASVTANDPEGASLTYTWSTKAGNGTFSDPNAATTTYTCAANSTHNIRIEVSDDDSACLQSRQLQVNCISNLCGGVNCDDDGNPCTLTPTCKPLTGACPASTPVATGAACDFAGMGDGLCDASQVCVECLVNSDCPDDGLECTTPSLCNANTCTTPMMKRQFTPCNSGGGKPNTSGVCDGTDRCLQVTDTLATQIRNALDALGTDQ